MKHLSIVFMFLLTLWGSDALAISTSIDGPSTGCPGTAATHAFSANTQDPFLWPIDFVRITVTGAGNTLTVIPTNGATCAVSGATTVICADGGGDVFGDAFVTWNSSGTITIEASRAGRIRSTSSKTFTARGAPGTLAIGGNTPVYTGDPFNYVLFSQPFSHTISGANLSVSPLSGRTVTQVSPTEISVVFTSLGTYTITGTATVTSPCGVSAQRTTSRTIVVDNSIVPRMANASLEAEGMTLSPNPVSLGEKVQIQIPSDGTSSPEGSLEIIDQTGKVVLVKPYSSTDQNLSTKSLAKGIYYVSFKGTGEQHVEVKKLVVN